MGKHLSLFHRLPPCGRDFAASAHGFYLRCRRYGPETDRLVAEAREREHWSPERLQQWQYAQTAELLGKAAELVPYYREHWQRRRAGGDRSSTSLLSNWPLLRKEQVRRTPEAFVMEGAANPHFRIEHTSGTTATPLRLWVSRETDRRWYACMEARWRGWYGLSRRDRWGILGGQLVAPIEQKKPPFWVWNAGLNQLYLSSYHLAPETCAAYVKALRQHRLVYLWGYASALCNLAAMIAQQGLEAPQYKVVISNAEPLFAHQRELISKVFGCAVRDTYGMSEFVGGASECDHGKLHLWPEAGVVEVLADESDEPVPWGTVGRLVCTGLTNQQMPLIRYEVGDRGAIAPPDHRCACGRTLPILLSVEGRSDDVILTADGRRIGRLDPVFKSDMPIREAQVIQESLDHIRLLVVPGEGFSPSTERHLAGALQERVGRVRIEVKLVTAIPRSANGKFRAVISRVKPSELAQRKRSENEVVVLR